MYTYKFSSLKLYSDLKSYVVTKNNNFKLITCRKFSVSDKKKDPSVLLTALLAVIVSLSLALIMMVLLKVLLSLVQF